MNRKLDCEEHQIFMNKIRELLDSSTFNDISINCKDGRIRGNRLILSVYSNFLTDIFIDNPLIISHPLCDDHDNGINLTEVSAKDVANLIKLLNSGRCVEISLDNLSGVLKVAKLLRIEVVKGKSRQGFVDIEAVPKLVEDEEHLNLDLCEPAVKEDTREMSELCVLDKEDSLEDGDFDDAQLAEDGKHSKVCPVCNITCKSWAGMKRHLGHAHRQDAEIADRDVIICKCGLSFSKHAKRRVFREHRQQCKAYRNEAFICDICECAFDSMPALNNHQFVVHAIQKTPKSCICGETFKTKHRVRKHEISCTIYRNAAILCKHCDLPFLTDGHLRQHLRTAHRRSAHSPSELC